jgi:ribosomal protein L9
MGAKFIRAEIVRLETKEAELRQQYTEEFHAMAKHIAELAQRAEVHPGRHLDIYGLQRLEVIARAIQDTELERRAFKEAMAMVGGE